MIGTDGTTVGGAAEEGAPETDALLSRLRVIEDQPLDRRASSFAQINDELQSALEGGDAPVRNA